MDKIDILNREEFVEKLVNLIENISKNKRSTSFAINGTWGCGKSFVLDMLEEQLTPTQDADNATDKYFIIRYNCWKYDYYEEPLVAIVAAIISVIENKTKLFPNSKEKMELLGMLKATGVALLSMVNSAVKEKTGVDFQTAYETVRKGEKEGAIAYENEHKYDVYFGFNQVIEKLSSLLQDLANKYTVILLVDELDRCLPEYAIKVLERLHHLTEGNDNIITVISMDKEQLKYSVIQTFGIVDPEKYLKKFIHFEVELNKGIVSERFMDKHANYVDLFDKNIIVYEDSIEEFMQAIFQKIDVREQEHLIQRAMLAHKLLFIAPKDYSFMCMELLIIVIMSQYKSIKNFTKWFYEYNREIESGKSEPPFDSFFAEKFKKVPAIDVDRSGTRALKSHMITSENSLYGAIAYMWFMLFLSSKKNNSLRYIELSNLDIYMLLDENIKDLKKFIDTIQFIK